jgi:hypothetical protein
MEACLLRHTANGREPRHCSRGFFNRERPGGVGVLRGCEAGENFVPVSRALALGTAGRGPPKALVARATLVLALTSPVLGIQEPVFLRLLAKPAGARPGDAELGCRGADGGAAAEQGGGLSR